MDDLSGYTIEFFRVLLFGTWSWRITTPDDRVLGPVLTPGWADRGTAERAALRRIEQDAARDELDGDELRRRVSESDAAGG